MSREKGEQGKGSKTKRKCRRKEKKTVPLTQGTFTVTGYALMRCIDELNFKTLDSIFCLVVELAELSQCRYPSTLFESMSVMSHLGIGSGTGLKS